MKPSHVALRACMKAPVVFLVLLLACSSVNAQAVPQLPLHTSGYQIVDAQNVPVPLKSVNWYGFDQKEFVPGGLDHAQLETIIGMIKKMGFNSVRLPWANETLEKNPPIPDYAIKANPQLHGKRAM